MPSVVIKTAQPEVRAIQENGGLEIGGEFKSEAEQGHHQQISDGLASTKTERHQDQLWL